MCNEVLPQSITLNPELINFCFLSEYCLIVAVKETDVVFLGKCLMVHSDIMHVQEETSGLKNWKSEKQIITWPH